MSDQHHVIKRQILEVEVGPHLPAADLPTRMSQLYRQQIVPLMDAYCSQLSDAETIHRIDRLEIDLGDIDLATFDTDYVAKAAAALARQLAQQLPRSPSPSSSSPQPVAAPASPSSTHRPLSLPAPPRSLPAASSTSPSVASPPVSSSPGSAFLSPRQAQLELIQTFLTTGQLPWWSAPLDHPALVECFSQIATAAPRPLATWLSHALKSPTVRQRVLNQFPESVWSTILQLLAPATAPAVQAYLADVEQLRSTIPLWHQIPEARLRQVLWQGLLLHVVLAPPASQIEIPGLLRANLLHLATQLHLDPPLLIQQLSAALSTCARANRPLSSQLPAAIAAFATAPFEADSARSQAASAATSAPTTTAVPRPPLPVSAKERALPPLPDNSAPIPVLDDLYLQNAGQVILGPFLHTFFTNLELVAAGQWLNLEVAQQAALILQYLVDESLVSVESSLGLNKLLCGLDPSATLPRQLSLTPAIESACTALLTVIIQHWSVLGNTTISGLRSAFLQRAGVLRQRHDGWLLQVEPQTHDILLDQLPWSIRVIKLPWMTEILYVEWL